MDTGNKTTNEMFTMMYPDCEIIDNVITCRNDVRTRQITLIDAFGLMFIHNFTVNDVVNELRTSLEIK